MFKQIEQLTIGKTIYVVNGYVRPKMMQAKVVRLERQEICDGYFGTKVHYYTKDNDISVGNRDYYFFFGDYNRGNRNRIYFTKRAAVKYLKSLKGDR